MTGAGSPIPPVDAGAGSPSPGDAGAGSPVLLSGEDSLAMSLRIPFASDAQMARSGFEAVYPDDGGTLVEVAATWPTDGPYRVQLRDALGAIVPGVDAGLLSGIPGAQDRIVPNRSRRYLRFVLPKLPHGTYDLLVSWNGGSTELAAALRIINRQVAAFTVALLTAFGTFPDLERLPRDGR